MKLTPAQSKTLQALHRDVCSKAELDHLFTDGHAADELVTAGLARVHAGFYSITVKGREVMAIVRREAAAIPKFNQPVVAYEAKKAETISINQILDIAELSAPQSGLFKATAIKSEVNQQKGKSMNAVIDTGITHTLKEVVDVVILKNQITRSELVSMFPMRDPKGKLRIHKDIYYLKEQEILREDQDAIFRVGSKCNAWLNKQARKARKAERADAVPNYKLVDTSELTKGGSATEGVATESIVESPDIEMPIPAFLRKDKSSLPSQVDSIHAAPTAEVIAFPAPSADLDFKGAHEAIDAELVFEYKPELVFESKPEPAAVDTFAEAQAETKRDHELLQKRARFAYTDEHTLMIMRPDHSPLELTPAETKRLLDFANEVSMVAVA